MQPVILQAIVSTKINGQPFQKRAYKPVKNPAARPLARADLLKPPPAAFPNRSRPLARADLPKPPPAAFPNRSRPLARADLLKPPLVPAKNEARMRPGKM